MVMAGLLAGSASTADEARRARLAAILEAASPPGVGDVEFVGCRLRQIVTPPPGCITDVSPQEITRSTDLSYIVPKAPRIGVEREGESQLVYELTWFASRMLRNQRQIASQVREEGYERFPDDVDARLRWYAETGFSDPALFDFASDTTRWCNGIILTQPDLTAGYLHVPTKDRDEFIALFAEELDAGCDAASVPQG